MQGRQVVILFEVKSFRELYETLNEYMLVGYIIMSLVTNKTSDEDRGDYIEVVTTMIYPGGLGNIEVEEVGL